MLPLEQRAIQLGAPVRRIGAGFRADRIDFPEIAARSEAFVAGEVSTDAGPDALVSASDRVEIYSPLAALLVERAEGNPFYMEELLRMIIDDGIIDARERPWRLQGHWRDAVREYIRQHVAPKG